MLKINQILHGMSRRHENGRKVRRMKTMKIYKKYQELKQMKELLAKIHSKIEELTSFKESLYTDKNKFRTGYAPQIHRKQAQTFADLRPPGISRQLLS